MDHQSPFISAYEKATIEDGLCPNRVWAVCGKDLPAVLPLNNDGIPNHQDHEQCTYEFCEYSQRDFTSVSQRHECIDPKANGCSPLRGHFSPKRLDDAVKDDQPTAWSLDGRSTIEAHQSYMAISHVWSDGTGTGAWPAGEVNACLYKFFRKQAYNLQCEGLWWDTLCMPQDKVLRTKVIRSMHLNYRDARVTLVHDAYLRKSRWVDAEHACFAILMSPWFSRGWTALELAESRKVKVMFGGPDGPLIKDLDEEILSKDEVHDSASHQRASQLIRNLRHARMDLNQLVTVLKSRNTSWAKDVTIIAGLLTGIDIAPQPGQTNISPQNIIVRLLSEKIGHVFPGHLFHNSASMFKGTSWCPISLLSLPLVENTGTAALRIDSSFNIVGKWTVLHIPSSEILEDRCIWGSAHPYIKEKIQSHLRTNRDQCLLLAERTEEKVPRALLVHRGSWSDQVRKCHLIGALYFHPPLMRTEVADHLRSETEIVISGYEGDDAPPVISPQPPSYSAIAVSDNTLLPGKDGMQNALSWSTLHTAIWRGLGDSSDDLETLLGLSKGRHFSMLNEVDHLGRQPLHLAAERGDINSVRFLLDRPDLVLSQDNEGRTALHYAAWSGSESIVSALLDHGLDPAAPDSDGKTALHFACEQGYIKIVKRLLLGKTGTKEQPKNNPHGLTPLHYASYRGHADVAELLIQEDGLEAVNAQDDQLRWTPLHLAALNGQDALIEILLQNGADAATQNNELGWTPLHCAAVSGHRGVTQRLLDQGCLRQTKDKAGWSAWNLAKIGHHESLLELLNYEQSGKSLSMQMTPPFKPIHVMAAHGQQALANLLFHFKASELIGISWESIPGQTNTWPPSDTEERTLLHAAVIHDRRGLAQQLLDENSDLNKQDNSKYTPLHYAVISGHAHLSGLLLQKGAMYDMLTFEESSVLHLAAESDYQAIFDIWPVDKSVDQKDLGGKTPLGRAAECGQIAFMEQLLARGAYTDAQDDHEETPLFMAARSGHLEAMKKLVGKGAEVTHKTKQGITALTKACQGGHIDVVEYLLAHDGFKSLKYATESSENCSLDIATELGHADCVMALLPHYDFGETWPLTYIPGDSRNKNDSYCSFMPIRYSSAELVQRLLTMHKVENASNDQESTKQSTLASVARRGYASFGKQLLAEASTEATTSERARSAPDSNSKEDKIPYPQHDEQTAEELHRRVIRLLIAADANPNIIINKTPLISWAAVHGHLELVRQLIETRGVPVDVVDELASRTPLGFAACGGGIGVVKYLLEKGADISHKDIFEHTPSSLGMINAFRQQDVMVHLIGSGGKVTDRWKSLFWAFMR